MSAITIEILEERVSFLQKAYNELKELVTGQQSEPTFTVKQVAIKLGISANGVNWHIREGNIKAKGKRYKKIKESDLQNYINTINKKPETKD